MRGSRFLSGPASALVCGLASIFAIPAHAAPLDPQACEQLQLKLDELRKFGVETDMALGVEAARTTLPAERFNRIGVYIETEEQLNFRCGLSKHRIILPTTVEGGEEEIVSPGETTAEGSPGTRPLPQRPPQATKDAAAKASSSAAKAPASAVKAPAAAVKAPAEAVKRRPAVAKAKDASAPAGAGAAAPAAKPAAPDGEPRKAAKKKAAKKTDDAYRPPAKPRAREEQAPPTSKQ